MNIPADVAIDIVENSHVLVMAEFSFDGLLLDKNKGFHIQFSALIEDQNKHYWNEFFIGDMPNFDVDCSDQKVQSLKTVKGDELLCSYRINGSTFYCIGEILAFSEVKLIEDISDLSNEMIQLTFQLRKDKKDLQKAYKLIEDISRKDPLTELYNRRAFFDLCEPKFSLAKRQAIPMTLFFIDLDNFKSVNDNWGHDIGDRLLQELANVLNKTFRLEDIVSRFGGEEFVILLAGGALEGTLPVAEHVLEQCRLLKIESVEGTNTLSIGIAQWNGKEDINQLITRADEACYMAKNSGRDKYIVSATPAS